MSLAQQNAELRAAIVEMQEVRIHVGAHTTRGDPRAARGLLHALTLL